MAFAGPCGDGDGYGDGEEHGGVGDDDVGELLSSRHSSEYSTSPRNPSESRYLLKREHHDSKHA